MHIGCWSWALSTNRTSEVILGNFAEGLLVPVYGRFVPRFETADLKEVKALLDAQY